MDNTPSDLTALKAQQREQWSRAAQGWRRRWPTFEKAAQPLSDRMMELAHVAPGQRVLDIATGIGEPAMTAARRVGPSGSVVAIDQAPEMLAVARERMQAAGVTNVEFVEGDAETVALSPESFDAVVCRWGLMFFADLAATLARLRTSLVSGGWLAAAVWGPPERVPIISLPFGVLSRALGRPPFAPATGPAGGAGPAAGGPFALAEPGKLEQAARDAGFAGVHGETFTVTFEWPSIDEMLGHLSDTSGPLRATLVSLSLERQAAIRAQLAAAAAPFARADGTVRLPNECLLVAGRR